MRIRILLSTFVLVFVASLFPLQSFAADYPTREIEFIAAFAPGSNTDTFARLAAKSGEKYLGKPVVVINKSGGGGAKGFAAIAAAKPDGYTIGLISQSVIAQPYLVKGVNYNYKRDFKIISRIDYSAEGLWVLKGSALDVPLPEFIKKIKANPGYSIGFGDLWTVQDFALAVFEDEAGIKPKRMPHPGGTELIPAVLGGHVSAGIGPTAEWMPLYKAGKVNVLALSTEKRDPRMPNIPTFKEQGVDCVLTSSHWVAAPAKTPDSVVKVLVEAFKKGFAEPAFLTAANNLGAVGAWEGPEDSLRQMETIEKLYTRVFKKYNLKLKPE